ncbi:MAG: four-carbon acid sugar kinase family protein [Deltaproteobacteria bacterium]|jgi:uncharacterized protein YgbK (DUF1537 family)|nr:four-carbon acid sugar kinase family protein [Deltaproteobacteria bacterium]
MHFCIVADDLSGACDTGLEFFRHGLPTAICLKPPDRAPAVLALDTESRNLEADEARRRVRELFSAGFSPPASTLYYKKVDSTLRGNIGAELDELRARLRLPVVFSPAFPHMGRTVADGQLLVRGVPVHLTFIGQDPLAPVRSAFLADALGGADAVLRRRDLRDRQSLRALLAGGARLCCDAATDDDLREIVRACTAVRAPEDILWAGSAGLAKALLDVLLPESVVPLPEPRAARLPLFLLVGSVNPVSRAQAERVSGYGGIDSVFLDMRAMRHGAAAEEERLAARILESLAQDRHTMLCSSAPGTRIAPEHSAAVSALCGRVACRVLRAARVGLFFATGGETAAHCLEELACTQLAVEGAAGAGIPYVRMQNGMSADLPLITKAGGFGGENLLLDICAKYGRRPDGPAQAQ